MEPRDTNINLPERPRFLAPSRWTGEGLPGRRGNARGVAVLDPPRTGSGVREGYDVSPGRARRQRERAWRMRRTWGRAGGVVVVAFMIFLFFSVEDFL